MIRATSTFVLVSVLLVQIVVPMEALAFKRTAQTVDYYGGIGGGWGGGGGLGVNSSAATGVTKSVVQAGTFPVVPPMSVGGVVVPPLPREHRTQIVKSAHENPKKLGQSLRTAQNKIVASATQCRGVDVGACMRKSLGEAILVTPEPIKSVLTAIQTVMSTPHGVLDILTASLPILQQLSKTVGSITSILASLKEAIRSLFSVSGRIKGKDDKAQKKCKNKKQYLAISEVRVAIRWKAKTYSRTVVICRIQTVSQNALADHIQPWAEEITQILPLVVEVSGIVPKKNNMYLIIHDRFPAHMKAFYRLSEGDLWIKPQIIIDRDYGTIAHEFSHVLSEQNLLETISWKSIFWEEGLAQYVKKTYFLTENKHGVTEKMMSPKQKEIITNVINQIQEKSGKQCFLFLDKEPIDDNQEKEKLNRYTLNYHISVLFIDFIKERFKNTKINIIQQLFANDQGLQDRNVILKKHVEFHLKKDMTQFCQEFFPYARDAVKTK